jgi:MtN3 and saliva related transmembrane protein
VLTLLAPYADWVGTVAATLTTLAFVPQVLKVMRTRDVTGISLAMYATFTLGVALWLGYGVLIGKWPIIIANIITLLLAGYVLWMVWRSR